MRTDPPSPTIPRFLQPRVSGTARVNVGTAERIASAFGGVALAAYGFTRGSVGGALLGGVGGALLGGVGAALLFRGASGYCPAFGLAGISTAEDVEKTPPAVEIAEVVTVHKSPQETYEFWRRLENLPRFMQHLASVHEMGDGRSLWKAKGPGVLPDFQWEAEVVQDEPARLLAWQSVEGSDVDNAGHVEFRPAPHGGTEVRVRIAYRAPAGDLGHAVAKRLDPVFGRLVKEDVRRFKNMIEAHEVPTTEGQPKGD